MSVYFTLRLLFTVYNMLKVTRSIITLIFTHMCSFIKKIKLLLSLSLDRQLLPSAYFLMLFNVLLI
jgi:hypothetical protein